MEEEKNAALGVEKPSKKLGGRPEGARKQLATKFPRKDKRSRGGELNFFRYVDYRNHKDALAKQKWPLYPHVKDFADFCEHNYLHPHSIIYKDYVSDNRKLFDKSIVNYPHWERHFVGNEKLKLERRACFYYKSCPEDDIDTLVYEHGKWFEFSSSCCLFDFCWNYCCIPLFCFLFGHQ